MPNQDPKVLELMERYGDPATINASERHKRTIVVLAASQEFDNPEDLTADDVAGEPPHVIADVSLKVLADTTVSRLAMVTKMQRDDGPTAAQLAEVTADHVLLTTPQFLELLSNEFDAEGTELSGYQATVARALAEPIAARARDRRAELKLDEEKVDEPAPLGTEI